MLRLPKATSHSEALGLRLDCRHYRGDRPCGRGCTGACTQFEPMGHRVLLIKLGALGDVIRTAALLPAIKAAWPTSHVTWISRPNGCRMLAHHPLIDRCLPLSAETLAHVEIERFDVVINLDKEPGPAALAMRVTAPDKRGMGLSAHGTVYPLTAESAAYFQLGLSNELKFHVNHKSYQTLIHEAVGLPDRGERYRLYPPTNSYVRAARVFADAGVGIDETVIGLNTGAGTVFANKTWPEDRFLELARRLQARGAWRVALLGGPEERERNARLASALGPRVVHTGCNHRELDFAAIVHRCAAVVTGDTTAMHVAVALQVPVVVLFGPTCHQEIDLYGCGVKLVADVPCAPCYRRTCSESPTCMDTVGVDRAEVAVRQLVNMNVAVDRSLTVLPGAGVSDRVAVSE